MTAIDLKPDSVPISITLLRSVASARQIYEDNSEKERQKNGNERAGNQKHLINNEIRAAKAKVMI